MSEIYRWSVHDANDDFLEEHYTFEEAKNDAESRAQVSGRPHAVIEVTYVFDDSALVWSTDEGQHVKSWPPTETDEETDEEEDDRRA